MTDPNATHVETTPSSAQPFAPPGYDLLDPVGEGGMGVVYRARDRAMSRTVAVKILHPRFAPDSATARRFVEEAHITGQLQHPGIPAVYHVGGLPDGRPFLAMKLIKGDTLADLLKSDAAVNRLAVFEAVAQAVGYAHAHDVIHRDLKPHNVMVGAFGEVQVMDWGLAKVLTSRDSQGAASFADPDATTAPTAVTSPRDSDTPYTQYGSALGTPAYMPPEQAAGELDKVGPRSDVFGLGAVLCALLTGRPPFDGKDAESVRINAVRGKTEEAFARLDASGADPGVMALCKRCLAFEPADRPVDANAVAKEAAHLRAAAEERARQAERDKLAAEVRAAEQAKRRRLAVWAGGAVAAVLLAGGGLAAVQWRRAERERDRATAQEVAAADALADVTIERDAKTAALTEAETTRRQLLATLRRITSDVVGEYLVSKNELTVADRRFLRDVLILWEAVAGSRGETPEARELIAEGTYNVAFILQTIAEAEEDERIADAEKTYRLAIALYEKLVDDFPTTRDYLESLAVAQANLGNLLMTAAGRAVDAEEEFQKSLALWEKLAVKFPGRLEDGVKLGGIRCNMGVLLRNGGKPANSLGWFDRAIATLTPVHAADPGQETPKRFLCYSYINRAQTLDLLGRPADALADWDRAIELAVKADKLRLRAERPRWLLKAGQVELAVAEVTTLTRLPGVEYGPNALYDFACIYVIACGKVAGKREEYAGLAIELLQTAVAAGYKDRLHMGWDKDLTYLRRRPDFAALLASLPLVREVAPWPRPAR